MMQGKSQKSLRSVDFFKDLAPDDRGALERRCRWTSFGVHEQIVGYLDSSDDILFLIAGRARVMLYSVSGKAVAFRDIGQGDFFGELAAIDGQPRSASVEALEPCLVACMPASVFREAFRSQPTVTDAVVRHLAVQVRTLTERVFEFSTLAVRNRIQAELLRLARAAGSADGRQARIEPAPTHEEIASRISTHRQAVTSELNRLAQAGLIEQHGRSLLVKDAARLKRMVNEATGE